MKKIMIAMVAIAGILSLGSIAKADVNVCAKDTQVSATKSFMIVKPAKGMTFITVAVYSANMDGMPVCSAKVTLTTSRNQSGDNWEENVDYVFNSTKTTGSDSHGNQVAEFLVFTDQPSGTTFYATINGTKLYQGIPASYQK